MERLRHLTVSKPAVIATLLVVAIMPWFRGGKDPVGWMVLLSVAVLGSFIAWRSPRVEISLGRLGWAWLALTIWTALSLIWTVNRFQTASWLLMWLFVGIIYVLARSIKHYPETRAIFTNGYLMVAALASVYGMVLFIFETYDRATSTFYLANPFAGFLLAAIVIGLWRFAENNRLSDGLITMISLSGFILADSRGAGLVLVVVLFISLSLSRQMFKHWRRVLIVLVGALALTLICNLARARISHHFTFQGARLTEALEGHSNSGTDRLYYLRSALAMWADRPLIGWGAGAYGTMHPQYQYRVISAGRDAHNFYVQSLGELGVIGFIILTWLVVEILLGLYRGLRQDQKLIPLSLAGSALLIHFGLDIDAGYPVLLVLAAGLIAFSHSSKARANSSVWILTPVTLGLSLVLALPAVALYRGSYNAEIAKSWHDLGDYEKAIEYYQRAATRWVYDPDWLTAAGVNYYTLASLGLGKDKNISQAADNAFITVRQDPHDAQHYYLRGQVGVWQSQPAAAERDYQQAIKLDPYNHPEYYNSLAWLYINQGKLSLADRTARVVPDLYSKPVLDNRNYDTSLPAEVANSHYLRAVIAQKLGQIEVARSFLAQALQLDPKNANAKQLSEQIGQ